MMYCPLCLKPAHMRKVNDLEDGSKETFHQCQNLECSTTFVSRETFGHIIKNSKITVGEDAKGRNKGVE
ncbi:ogr/Delta-like zinc finger family protein [Rahnella inusitata]|uniref:Late control protein B n=1 Tax=Rahnella inusitata TaxID=58169 RepID=A0ABX9P5D8_9GAMM|nr:late control protein B [Rahnella inusitata]